ncbi:GHMP kinase, N-terminal domain-containing protein [Cardiosporidium cionae]|uniref:GHMP kinase, N-terminal domain-containing protein n=1 Tax=Cardiosporidium cionae TaxID=476202 RepID=A0ABQ7JD15_9APIC|nr:GHMP kinase, N-terminal domain-containing protein [Cardiosporidium cionae]|eukprot:KAF8821931.1 GHMP kinase, N-terminal domain-containing protein [Cardiosporidium cionae]
MESKIEALAASFKSEFGVAATVITSAPGRINMIGEHIDYNSYTVLPICISRCICLAINVEPYDGPAVIISNADSKNFSSVVFENISDLKISPTHSWTNYIIAALIGFCEYKMANRDFSAVGSLYKSFTSNENMETWNKHISLVSPNIRILVDGDIPKAVGLSSSSALVVSSLLALTIIDNFHVTRRELAEVCARSERHVGTAGGGMDQAAMCLSIAGCGQHISFKPIKAVRVNLPQGARVVVANSMVESEKALSAATHFNRRVFECKISAYILLKALCPDHDVLSEDMDALDLGSVQARSGLSLEDLSAAVDNYLHQEDYDKDQILLALGNERLNSLLKGRVGPGVWVSQEGFKLWHRAKHVYSEAIRVLKFVETCANAAISDEDKATLLGKLMNESDHSCDFLYECGSPELRTLTSLSRSCGALGSRLTGAGWGGFTVSLVSDEAAANSLIEKLKENYAPFKNMSDKELNEQLLLVEPAGGVSAYCLSKYSPMFYDTMENAFLQ